MRYIGSRTGAVEPRESQASSQACLRKALRIGVGSNVIDMWSAERVTDQSRCVTGMVMS